MDIRKYVNVIKLWKYTFQTGEDSDICIEDMYFSRRFNPDSMSILISTGWWYSTKKSVYSKKKSDLAVSKQKLFKYEK